MLLGQLSVRADSTGLENQRPAIAKQQEEEEWHDAKDYYNSGVASLDKLEYAKAISDFTEAITLDPNYFAPTTIADWPTLE